MAKSISKPKMTKEKLIQMLKNKNKKQVKKTKPSPRMKALGIA
jgi:hypothetical protein